MKNYQKTRIKRKPRGLRSWWWIAGAAVLLLATISVLEGTNVINVVHTRHTTPVAPKTNEPINLNPPTEAEKQSGDDQKKQIVEQEQQAPTPTPTAPLPNSPKKSVTPVISSATITNGQVDVRGYVPGVFEDNGTCTATFAKGTSVVTKTTTGFEDFNKTTCRPFTFAATELPGGGWSVKLSYASSIAEGTSDAVAVQ